MNKWVEGIMLSLFGLMIALFLTMGITVGIIILWIKDRSWH